MEEWVRNCLTLKISKQASRHVGKQRQQKQADEMRAEEKGAWTIAKSDFEQGLGGVQMALQVLRDYYAKKYDAAPALVQADDMRAQMALVQSSTAKSDGAASGIIGMLEVAESDFTKLLADGNADEDVAQKEYDTFMTDSKVDKQAKSTDVEHKTAKKQDQKQALTVKKDDLEGTQKELDAALAYFDKLKPSCVDSGVSYEDRVARREDEIKSLKDALGILNGEDLA